MAKDQAESLETSGAVDLDDLDLGEETEPMAEVSDAPAEEEGSAGEGAKRGPLWQIPLLAVSALMLLSGLYLAVRTAPGPDMDAALDTVERLLAAGDYDRWEQALNNLAPHLPKAEHDRHIARFHFLKADGLHQLQRSMGESIPAYNQLIITSYERGSEEYGGSLGGTRHANLAEAYAAVGREHDAIRLADGLPETHAGRRHAIYGTIIERRLSGSHPDHDGAVSLIERLLRDSTLPVDLRAWAYGRRAEALLSQGYADRALTVLLRDIQRAEAEGAGNVGDLLALLGRAYFDYGDHESARRYLLRAEARLESDADAMPRVVVLLARLDQAAGNVIEARDSFTIAMREYGGSPAYDAALLGRAETSAALGLHEEALADYRHLVSRQHQTLPQPRDTSRRDILQSLLGEHGRRLVGDDFERALELAEVAHDLFAGEEVPPEVLHILADSHRALAEHLLRQAVGENEEPDRILLVEAPLRRTIRHHFSLAGDAYIRHARRMTLTNNLVYGESLWMAANAYDQAGAHREAIDAFLEYLQSRDRDVREPAVRYRLGRLHQARGDFEEALSFFESLIAGEHRTTQEARASYVPLAQCLLALDAERNFEAAERSLLYVIEGVDLDPSAREFREALIELGLVYHRVGQFPRAIERLEEAVARYPDHTRVLELQFKLADARRLEAERIAEALQLAMQHSERLRLDETRRERLTRAGDLYGLVRDTLAARDPRRLTSLERVMLRESYFFKADCLYALGDYDESIREYNIAIGHYGDHPASLFASVQKVNAFVALGRYRDARTAHESARLRLAALTDADFDKPEFNLMTRRQWEEWLDSILTIEDRMQAGVDGG